MYLSKSDFIPEILLLRLNMLKNVNYDYNNLKESEFNNIVKKFFKKFCKNYIEHNLEFFKQMKTYKNHLVMPCLECENCNLSSIVCAIDKITKIHLPEYTFQLKDSRERRRIDLWCRLPRQGINKKTYDFFIELKTHSHCSKELAHVTEERLRTLIAQIDSIKKDINPQWNGKNIYLGLMIIPGYHTESAKTAPDVEDLKEGVLNIFKANNKYQVMFASWNFSEKIKDHIKNYKATQPGVGNNRLYDWILITGIVLTENESEH